MTKIMALDLGDQWIGVALSDVLRMLAKPYTTVTVGTLTAYLQNELKNTKIDTIIIGYPKTMKGGESEQTKKIVAQKEELEKLFPEITFILWDERLSSKRAQTAKPAKTKEEKLKSHAIAAAFILDSYLQFLANQNTNHALNE